MQEIIDSHIHLDKYGNEEIDEIVHDAVALITVSMGLDSCMRNLLLSQFFPNVKPAFGFHPEQWLPSEQALMELLLWIKKNEASAIAIGEVGLPYYLRVQNKLSQSMDQYIEVLEEFIKVAKQLNKPIILHAVYEDAHIACDLLEKHSVQKAHFHWFKGDNKIVSRLETNRYYISVTPDLLYEEETRKLVQAYPLEYIMAETDGPWTFKGKFKGRMTRPAMIHETLMEICKIKQQSIEKVYTQVLANTKKFYIVKSSLN